MLKKILVVFLFFIGCSVYNPAKTQELPSAQTYTTLSAYKVQAREVFARQLDFAIKAKKAFDVTFVIRQDGTLEQAKILRSAGKEMDERIIAALGQVQLDPIPEEFERTQIYYKFGFAPDTKSEDVLRYEREAQSIITQNIPDAPRKIEEIWFNLTVERTGAVRSVEILRSSGDSGYDNRLIKQMQSLNFPAFGRGLKTDTIEIPFRVQR